MPVIWTVMLVLIGVSLLAALLWPRLGLLSRLKDWQALRQREQVEDALKHLLDYERQGQYASPESLAGTIDLPVGKVMALIGRMQTQGLIEHRGAALHLTAEGERWALHVVRAHRLWERYLADEARMPLEQVHHEANRREHGQSKADLDDLDAALGHPARDPHGDPIPNRMGQMAVVDCAPLTNWPVGRPARIIHLEDEPAVAYQQILAAGLRLGQTIHILEATPERYVISDGESETHLAPSVAANVHVEPLPEEEAAPIETVALFALAHNQPAEIVELDEAVQGFTRRRFLDLGLTPGTLISPELKNFFGDPRAYRVRGTLIALRKDQAALILVRPIQPSQP